MSAGLEKLVQKRELATEIGDIATPERCFGCNIPKIIAKNLAEKVLNGLVDKPKAIEEMKQDLESQCQRGKIPQAGGCFNPDSGCTYATSFPVPGLKTEDII